MRTYFSYKLCLYDELLQWDTSYNINNVVKSVK